MNARRAVAALALGIFLVTAESLCASTQRQHLEDGLEAFRAGAMLDAAALWLVGNRIRESQPSADAMYQAKFSPGSDPYPLLLSAVALERAQSPLAFEAWMHARSLLRRQGDRWSAVQERLLSGQSEDPLFERVAIEVGLPTFEGPTRVNEITDWWVRAERESEFSLRDLAQHGGRLARSRRWSERLAPPVAPEPAEFSPDSWLETWLRVEEGDGAVGLLSLDQLAAFSEAELELLPADYWQDVSLLEPLNAEPASVVWSYDLGGLGLTPEATAGVPAVTELLPLRKAEPSPTMPTAVASDRGASEPVERPGDVAGARSVPVRAGLSWPGVSWSMSWFAEVPVTTQKEGSMRPDTDAFVGLVAEVNPSETQRALAQVAWSYLERNERETGLVNSVDAYPMLTLWDLGSQIAAVVSAHQLGVLDDSGLTQRFDRLFETFSVLPFYGDELPNREYDARTGKKTASGRLPKEGSGWSAIDIGRLLIWLRIVHDWYPDRRPAVLAFVERMDLSRLVRRQQMFGVLRTKREWLRQEGRYPYEQYAAAGFRAWGVVLEKASGYGQVATATVEGVELRHDQRPLSFLTSDPLALGVVELDGIDEVFAGEAERLYEAQKARWVRTGTLTAVNEDSIDRAPWFVYNSAYALGEPWLTLSHSGKRTRSAMALSTKAAFLWSSIHEGDEYSVQLRLAASELFDANKGFAAGRYDTGKTNRSYNVNTNGVVLEALLYEARGRRPFLARSPLAQARGRATGGLK